MSENTKKAPRAEYKRVGKRPTCYMQHWLFVAATMKAGKPDESSVFDFEVWKKQIFNLGHDFAQDNDRFSKAMFYTSCGLPPKRKGGS